MSKKILKRSLALGALMAFVITGSVWAGETVGDKYYVVKGNQGEVVAKNHFEPVQNYITYPGERVVGGWKDDANGNTTLNSKFTVTGGSFKAIVGGNWDVNKNMSVESTDLTINGATVKQTYGGSMFSGSIRTYSDNIEMLGDISKGRSTSLTILKGKFGGEKDNTDCPEMLVVGGDILKSTHESSSPTYDKFSSIIENSNVNIDGGDFYAAVIGGSVSARMYGDYGNGSVIKSVVGKTNVTITGGNFYDAIVAGGFAWGHYTESVVDNATLNISGESGKLSVYDTDKGTGADIYAGGLLDWYAYNDSGRYVYGEHNNETDGAIVKASTISISNATVRNIFGTDGYIKNTGSFSEFNGDWEYSQNNINGKDAQAVNTALTLTNVQAKTVDIPKGSITLAATGNGSTKIETLKFDKGVDLTFTTDGATNDELKGKPQALMNKITVANAGEGDGKANLSTANGLMKKGSVVGEVTFKTDAKGNVIEDSVQEAPHEGNAGVTHNANIALMAWRAETNDMNKRMGELRNANGEYGVWARMVGGEDEFKDAKYEYTQYQLGYDEKLSVDPSWTVGVALSYTDGESSFTDGSGENTHKGLSVYGSKLNDDGSFIDLIAKYSRLEHELTLEGDKGDYSTNGYSVSAEYGKRFQQGKGLWIEPQVELTYGKVKDAEYKLGDKTVSQDAMESLVGRVGFSLGKDIKDGNVYARASYLYDFEGETNMAFTNIATRNFKYDLGGGWWEVGVGANINLSKATYIYADVEKTFGGEVDTNWQWNLGVRYSF